MIKLGGQFGAVSATLRTIGGREVWDDLVPKTPGRGRDTVGQALGNRDPSRAATGGQDYQIIDKTVTFQVFS